jgi:hypothetical protein
MNVLCIHELCNVVPTMFCHATHPCMICRSMPVCQTPAVTQTLAMMRLSWSSGEWTVKSDARCVNAQDVNVCVCVCVWAHVQMLMACVRAVFAQVSAE